MTADNHAQQAALKLVLQFFKAEKHGIRSKQALLQFIDISLEAMKRHDQDPHVIQILEALCEELLGLNNVDSADLRASLRSQMTWLSQT